MKAGQARQGRKAKVPRLRMLASTETAEVGSRGTPFDELLTTGALSV